MTYAQKGILKSRNIELGATRESKAQIKALFTRPRFYVIVSSFSALLLKSLVV